MAAIPFLRYLLASSMTKRESANHMELFIKGVKGKNEHKIYKNPENAMFSGFPSHGDEENPTIILN